MTPEQITAERARLAKLRELNMPEPGAERLLAHIDAMTAAVPDAMTLGRAMDYVDAEDDALGVVGRGRKVDRIIAAYRAILNGETPLDP
jgi:hypothetical protein